jgi:hypothetical protein
MIRVVTRIESLSRGRVNLDAAYAADLGDCAASLGKLPSETEIIFLWD